MKPGRDAGDPCGRLIRGPVDTRCEGTLVRQGGGYHSKPPSLRRGRLPGVWPDDPSDPARSAHDPALRG